MEMKLGIGLYRHMLKPEYFQFAKQCGCTHLIVHLATYYDSDSNVVTATDSKTNYGNSYAKDPIWELDNLLALKREAAEYGLEIYGIENFSPADWYDVLLAGPKRDEQIEYLKKVIDMWERQAFLPLDITSVWPASGGIRRSMPPGAEQSAPALTRLWWMWMRPFQRAGMEYDVCAVGRRVHAFCDL